MILKSRDKGSKLRANLSGMGKMLLANRKPHEALQMFEKYLSLVPAYYQWKKDLSTRSRRTRKNIVFLQIASNFDKVFWYIEKAKLEVEIHWKRIALRALDG